MRRSFLMGFIIAFLMQSSAQMRPWVESLPIAKIMARAQNKNIVMIWENASQFPLPVLVKNNRGKTVVIDDLFASESLNEIIWDAFIPVVVGEESYGTLFAEIDGKRSAAYIDKFNNDSLKVLDANGNIIGTSSLFVEILNFSKFLAKYGMDTSYIQNELINYNIEKNFYSAFYLASKYVDYSLLVNEHVRDEILDLSDTYFKEAEVLLNGENPKDKVSLKQRLMLTKLKQDLIKGKSRKVLRQLRKIQDSSIESVNQSLLNFLYYTAYRLQSDKEKFQPFEKQISLLNLKQTQLIVDINR